LTIDFSWGDKKKRVRRKIPQSAKNAVWAKYIGMLNAEGKCYVCKRSVHITDFEVGHNRALSKGGSDNVSNLRPICRSCNSSMGTKSIETYKKTYFSKAKKKAQPKKKKRKPEKKSAIERFLNKEIKIG